MKEAAFESAGDKASTGSSFYCYAAKLTFLILNYLLDLYPYNSLKEKIYACNLDSNKSATISWQKKREIEIESQ